MEVPKTLRLGRAFEKEVFGVTDEEDFVDPSTRPSKRTFERSVKAIIDQVWAEYEEATRKGLEAYNPTDPKVGKTSLIFNAVKKHLPRRVNGRSTYPLNLFIAVGRTSLDWQHGVDAFFFWEGEIVTIDASTRKKEPSKIKADFLLHPDDLIGEALDSFGKKVAEVLKYRRQLNKQIRGVPKKKRLKIVESED